MLVKEINLVFGHSAVRVESSTDSTLVTLRINSYVLDEGKSKPGHEYYNEAEVSEIYLESKELKEVIKALQEVVVEEETE